MKNYLKALILSCGILFSLTAQSQSNNQLFAGPSYMYFGDREGTFSTFGITGEYAWKFSRKWGLMFEAGYYSHSEPAGFIGETDRFLNISAGFSYYPKLRFRNPNINLVTHALAGLSIYTSRYPLNNEAATYKDHSLSLVIGAGLDWKLNSLFSLRILQVDLAPTMYFESLQPNPRISAGLAINLPD